MTGVHAEVIIIRAWLVSTQVRAYDLNTSILAEMLHGRSVIVASQPEGIPRRSSRFDSSPRRRQRLGDGRRRRNVGAGRVRSFRRSPLYRRRVRAPQHHRGRGTGQVDRAARGPGFTQCWRRGKSRGIDASGAARPCGSRALIQRVNRDRSPGRRRGARRWGCRE